MPASDEWLNDYAGDLKVGIAFLTRLPLPRDAPIDGAEIGRAVWAFPLVGLIVGCIGAVAYGLAHRAGLPPWPSAALSVAATLLATGCLHEDGLADTADGFGGGATPERKLDIMRDSRIGTYGVCGLTLALLLRTAALASIAGTVPVGWALLAAHAGARAALPAFMVLVPAARGDGLSFSAGRPPQQRVAIAAALGVAILLVCLGLAHGIAALALLAVVVALMAWLAFNQIEGQTGDVIGALEQAGEIAILLAALG
jgi:adenosylcobinamide-GDP ribazoletransferase